MNDKFENLKKIINDYGSVIIAFSGGVDSSLLAKLSYEILKENAIAVTGISEVISKSEIENAKKIANEIGIKHIIIETSELENPEFIKNDKNRCYYCKSELFCKLLQIAKNEKCNYVIEGSNIDDLNDYRPGMKAIKEAGIKQPYIEAGISKKEIREYAKQLNLSNWLKPANPCLSSRIPYGQNIEITKLRRIELAEEFLKNFDIENIRVRDYNEIARIEVNKSDFKKIFENAESIIINLKKLGYKYITLDLEGYKTGSMNKVLIE
ncbi:MAG TPA: ATP-dependent sacrificial sulfur transferase LarE [bacterium]|nr:ATP-dependent sacrificial sulfur transferase LarE [bacterium]HOL48468.1 ATP-dependent sacrificial sulfur transferase LarE [bacterium]HPQ19821.1 ATP-dependent sacrificial sulfur transferase LarE [bacterium]